jgi:hypothetical protein
MIARDDEYRWWTISASFHTSANFGSVPAQSSNIGVINEFVNSCNFSRVRFFLLRIWLCVHTHSIALLAQPYWQGRGGSSEYWWQIEVAYERYQEPIQHAGSVLSNSHRAVAALEAVDSLHK